MRYLPLLLLPLALAKSYVQQQQPLQVFLHPPPPSPAASAPTLTPDQAKAVLSHHLGEPIGDFEEVPGDISIWGHLVGAWNHLTHPSASSSHAGSTEARPRVVIIEGVSPQEVLPTNLPPAPAFYIDHQSSFEEFLAPYLYRARYLLEHILDSLPDVLKAFKDTFEMAGTKAAEMLGHELNCLAAMAENLEWKNEAHSLFDAIRIEGLGKVPKNTEVWETGRKGVQAGLLAMTTPGSPPLLVIVVPAGASHHRRQLQPQFADNSSTGVCYSSNQTCSQSTSCSGNGVCAVLSTQGGKDCWGCQCASGFAGPDCQKTDYSVPFVILLFTSVILVLMVVGSIALLFSVGETKLPSTLTLAVGHSKRD